MLIYLLANWKWLLGAAASIALSIALLFTRADAAHWHKTADQQALLIAKAKQDAAEQERGFEKRRADAAEAYAARAAALEPIIVHSKDVIHDYRQTAAGAVVCAGPERVRGIDALDAALEHTGASATGAVPDTTGAAAGGR